MGFFDILNGIKDAVVEEGQKSKQRTIEYSKEKLKNASDSQLKSMLDKASPEGKRLIREEMNKRGI
jgi:hypothetical protein